MTGKEVSTFAVSRLWDSVLTCSHWRLMDGGRVSQRFKLGSSQLTPVWWLRDIIEWLEAKARRATAP